jgi:hypothetical protein
MNQNDRNTEDSTVGEAYTEPILTIFSMQIKGFALSTILSGYL